MPLAKETISISFAQGRDAKTDPWHVPIGKFLQLYNSVFNKTGRLTKRNGNKQLATLSASFNTVLLATYQGGLLAIGNVINAYAQTSQSWVNKGSYLPLSLSVQSLVRSSATQNQCDVAATSSGQTCVAYTEAQGAVTSYKYAIFDPSGACVAGPTAIVPGAGGTVNGAPRVFLLGAYFIIVFSATISATEHLQYVAIPTANPTSPGTATDISTVYTQASTVSWDGVVANNNLYIAWNATAAGIKMMYLDPTLTAHSTVTPDASHQCTMMSVCADITGNTPVIWVTYYNSSGTIGYTFAVNQAMTTILAAVEIFSTGTLLNLATVAQNQTLTVYYEVSNNYGYDSTLASNYIQTVQVPQAGLPTMTVTIASPAVFTVASTAGLSVGQPIFFTTSGALPTGLTAGTVYFISAIVSGTTFNVSTTNPNTTSGGTNVNTSGTQSGTHSYVASSILVRGMGLASKAFLQNSVPYFLGTYSSTNQPTYFLMNGSGKVQGKLAYLNGGGYLTTGLPSAVLTGSKVTIGYLFKDLIQPVNRTQGAASSAAVYTQTGINAATFNFSAIPTTAEIGGALHLSGGQLWMYDGTQVVEHGFHLFPDNVEAVWSAATFTTTATPTTGSAVLTSVGSTAGVAAGMAVTGTGIPASTTVVSFTANTITMSALATSSPGSITITLSVAGSIKAQPDSLTNTNAYAYQVIYSWMDAQGNIHRSNTSLPIFVTTTGAGSTGAITLNFPSLRSTLKTLVKIDIFRWSVAQQAYFQVTSITSPTMNTTTADSISYVDTLADTSIVGNAPLYTGGNVLGDDAAPATNLLALFDSRLWLVDAEDPNLLWFSKEVDVGSPVELSENLTKWISPTLGAQGNTGNISMMAPMDDKMILFKANAAIYFFNGLGPDLTGAQNQYSQPIFVAATVSCTNPNVALIPSGLVFQSDKGIWRLGRNLMTDYLGASVEDYNSQTVQAALTIPGTNQVRFNMSGGQQLMYDYFEEQWGVFQGVKAGSSVLFQSLQTSIDTYGRVFQENPGSYLDGANPVLMSFTTGWITPAGLQGYQRAYWAFLLGQYLSPHKLTVGIAYDYNPSIAQQVTIAPDNYVPNWGGDSKWGSGTAWGGPGNLEQWQINFKQQTCEAFQLTVNELFDSTKGQAAGAGLTLSGLDLVVGLSKKYPKKLPATRMTG